VTAFASAIANWSRPITGDFQKDVDELRTAIPRMQRLGTRFIRTMSWVEEGVDEDTCRDEVLRRYRELARIAEDGDVVLAHENCTGWAGHSAENMRRLIEETGSDHLVVLFDIGNTVSHGFDPWEYYTGVKDLIRYVHIKDCRRNPEGGHSDAYAYAGEGDAMVQEFLDDLIGGGYDGVISIEPHVASVVHDGGAKVDPEQQFQAYVKYGRIVDGLVKRARDKAS